MLPLLQTLQIADVIVRLVVIDMVNFAAIRDRAAPSKPDLTVQAKRLLWANALVRALVI
jgi:hypothetical protein